jgi:hypothetical protein
LWMQESDKGVWHRATVRIDHTRYAGTKAHAGTKNGATPAWELNKAATSDAKISTESLPVPSRTAYRLR